MTFRRATKSVFVGLLTIAALSGACGDNTSDSKDATGADTTTTTAAASTAGDLMLTAKDANSTQTVTVGQKIVVALDQNGGTGYSWQTSSVDTSIVKELSNEVGRKEGSQTTSADGSPMVGTPETVTVTYQAVAAGTTKVVLGHIPPGSDKAEETFTITVTVTA
jgi:predicted secreted protein